MMPWLQKEVKVTASAVEAYLNERLIAVFYVQLELVNELIVGVLMSGILYNELIRESMVINANPHTL